MVASPEQHGRSTSRCVQLAPGNGITGADSVRSAIDDLGAKRIAHGVLCFGDEPLVGRLVCGLPLTSHLFTARDRGRTRTTRTRTTTHTMACTHARGRLRTHPHAADYEWSRLSVQVRDGICLDICPSSNVLLGSVSSIEEHPLPRFLRQGVPATINSDDPLLFGPRLLDEYEMCRAQLGLTDAEVAQAATNSFQHSMAPEAIKVRGVEDVQLWLETAA